MKEHYNKTDLFVRICLLPLIIGFGLVIANISMKIFKIIGWVLLIFGILTGSSYLLKFYKNHKEEIKEFYRRTKIWRRKSKQLSDEEVDKKMGEEE